VVVPLLPASQPRRLSAISRQSPALLTPLSQDWYASKSQLLYDWRCTAHQFVLAPSPLRLTTTEFFQLNPCGDSPYITSCLTRGWTWLLCVWSSVHIAHLARYWQFFLLHYMQVLCKADHAKLTYLVLLSRWSSWYSFGTDHAENAFSYSSRHSGAYEKQFCCVTSLLSRRGVYCAIA
jgi:hypothetical protein